jgi:uncharacterized protein DUF4189
MKLLILLCASFALWPASIAVAGDCVVDCMYRSGCWSGGSVSNPAMCNDQQHRCQIQCDGQNKKSYGAIAYSKKDQGVGWSYGWNDVSKAKKVALDNCSKHGSGCEIWVWYANSCGAIAADGKIVTWGSASAKQSADQRALAECAKAGGRKCVIQASQCSR